MAQPLWPRSVVADRSRPVDPFVGSAIGQWFVSDDPPWRAADPEPGRDRGSFQRRRERQSSSISGTSVAGSLPSRLMVFGILQIITVQDDGLQREANGESRTAVLPRCGVSGYRRSLCTAVNGPQEHHARVVARYRGLDIPRRGGCSRGPGCGPGAPGRDRSALGPTFRLWPAPRRCPSCRRGSGRRRRAGWRWR